MRELWRELGQSMRILRRGQNRSLRWVEAQSGCGRGTLSQVETGKARAPLRLVEWYDGQFGGDGLLLSIYAAAVLANEPGYRGGAAAVRPVPGDVAEVVSPLLATGALVGVGEDHKIGWVLVNAGSVPWRSRSLRRLGAVSAPSLITSARIEPIPDCDPGEYAEIALTITTPAKPGTVVAYWEIVDEVGAPCYSDLSLTTILVVR